MSKQEFEAILNAKANAAKEQPQKTIDWNSKKAEWLASLTKFYQQLDSWILEYVKSGKIAIERSEVEIEEQYLGKYNAEARVLMIGEERIQFRPIGTLLIGVRGRIDMEGPKGIVKFILTGKYSDGVKISIKEKKAPVAAKPPKSESPEEYVWKIATSPPKVRFIELNSDTFFDSVTEVLNG
jgi:hypothetical protein